MLEVILVCIVCLQAYIIYVLFRVISNAARFVLLLSTFCLIGNIVIGYFPTVQFENGYFRGKFSFVEFDIPFSILVSSSIMPWYIYGTLLALCVIALHYTPKIDDANEKRLLIRAFLEESMKKVAKAKN